jgi:hypothetical protein
MSIYCPLAEALGIETTISILDIPDDNNYIPYVIGGFTGKNHTDETKLLLSKLKTEEFKRKVSKTMREKGLRPPSQKGMKRSDKHIQKMTEGRLKSDKFIEWNLSPKSDEHKRKISESVKKYWEQKKGQDK